MNKTLSFSRARPHRRVRARVQASTHSFGGTAQERTLDGLLYLEALKVKTPGQQTVLSVANTYGKVQELELTPFHGHLNLTKQGVCNAKTNKPQAALSTGVSPANDRAGAGWTKAQRIGQRIWLPRNQYHRLGTPSRRHAHACTSGCPEQRRTARAGSIAAQTAPSAA